MSERLEKLQKLAKEEFGVIITKQNAFMDFATLFGFTVDELASVGAEEEALARMQAIEKAETKLDLVKSGTTNFGPFYFDDDVIDWCKKLIRDVGIAPEVYQSAGICIPLEWKTNHNETLVVEVENGMRIAFLQKDRLDRVVELRGWKPGTGREEVVALIKQKLGKE